MLQASDSSTDDNLFSKLKLLDFGDNWSSAVGFENEEQATGLLDLSTSATLFWRYNLH